jgi:hypothetical protein
MTKAIAAANAATETATPAYASRSVKKVTIKTPNNYHPPWRYMELDGGIYCTPPGTMAPGPALCKA